MQEKEHIFTEAFNRGKEGGVSEIETWLEESGIEAVDVKNLREILRQNPESSIDLEEELETLGEYVGRLEGKSTGGHLAIIGVDDIGKTQLCNLLKSLVENQTELKFELMDPGKFQEVEEEDKLQEVLKDIGDNEKAVVCLDDAWKDKKISFSLEKINDEIENVLIISTWTPAGWSQLEGEVNQSAPVENRIDMTPFSAKDSGELVMTTIDKISEQNYAVSQEFCNTIHEGSQGIPGLTLRILRESVNQAFLNDIQLFGKQSAQLALEATNLSSHETLKGLNSVKKQIANMALRERDERGIRPKKLSESLQKSKSTISYHLREMESKKMLERNQVGRSTFYKIRDEVKPLIQLQLQGESEFYA